MEIQTIGAAAEEEPRAARILCWEWEYHLQPTGDIDVSDLLLQTLTYVMPRAPQPHPRQRNVPSLERASRVPTPVGLHANAGQWPD